MAETLQRVYLICSGLSLTSCILVLGSYAGTPSLSRFPSSMLRWRIICDALISVQFLMVNAQQLFEPSPGNDGCSAILAFLVQFGLFGTLSWYAPFTPLAH